jgi:hypothetical protein
VAPASQENKNNAPKQQQKSGDKNRNNRNRGRGGKGNGNKDNDAQNQAPQQSGEPKRRSKDSGTIDSSVSFQNGNSLFGSADFFGTTWSKWAAKIIMTCIVLVWNYLGRKIFIFKS